MEDVFSFEFQWIKRSTTEEAIGSFELEEIVIVGKYKSLLVLPFQSFSRLNTF